MSWRNTARPIIEKVLQEYPIEGKEQKQALYDAYPFGQRAYHPYKVWQDEIQKQKLSRTCKAMETLYPYDIAININEQLTLSDYPQEE